MENALLPVCYFLTFLLLLLTALIIVLFVVRRGAIRYFKRRQAERYANFSETETLSGSASSRAA